MPSAWIDDPKIEDAFQDFLQLYDAYVANKSTSPERLQLRIDKVWGDLRLETKKDWTYRLIKLGKIDENLARAIKEVKGTIIRFFPKPIPHPGSQ